MSTLFMLYGVFCVFVAVEGAGNAGRGLYSVQYIERCGEEDHKMEVDVEQTKINRTHDGWNGHLSFQQPFTHGFTISVEIRQLVDGGYKLLNEIVEPDLVDFLIKHAEKNVKQVLEAAGIDPPEFPVEAGDYDFSEFIFDYTELDNNGFYGEYTGKVTVMSEGEEVFCILAYVEFTEEDDAGF